MIAARWWVLCGCGFARRAGSASGAEATAAWHRREGCEGCDHAPVVEYRDARLVPNERSGGRR